MLSSWEIGGVDGLGHVEESCGINHDGDERGIATVIHGIRFDFRSGVGVGLACRGKYNFYCAVSGDCDSSFRKSASYKGSKDTVMRYSDAISYDASPGTFISTT